MFVTTRRKTKKNIEEVFEAMKWFYELYPDTEYNQGRKDSLGILKLALLERFGMLNGTKT